MDFCHSLDSIDQPNREGTDECPPKEGFAVITMSAWVMPMFIVPVSLLGQIYARVAVRVTDKPQGPYYFKFDAITNEGDRIYCLDAQIHLDYKDMEDRHRLNQISLDEETVP